MVEKTDLVEDVHHDTGVSALGKNVQCNFGMDEGDAEEDRQPTLAVQKENVMRKRKDLSNSTPSSYFCDGDGEGEGLFLSNGERPNPFPEHKLLNGEVEIDFPSKESYRPYIPE